LSIWLGERLRKSKVALEQGVAERLVGKLAAALDQGAEAFAVIDQSAEARGRA